MRLCALLIFAVGCGQATDPAWGVDTLTLEPIADGLVPIQRWDVFDEDWMGSASKRDHVCGAVVVLQASERDADCPDCLVAWSTEGTLRETDCEGVIEEAFLRVTAVGLGSVAGTLTNEDPHPGVSIGAWVQIDGSEWLPQGWAYPESLDFSGSPASVEWNDEEIFTVWPDAAWPL
ncbi:MAG: hypothetical protein KC912_16830 [Proteobacteria bacterium]|nr:hypothetical protein [Pseudomonadota bacterium]